MSAYLPDVEGVDFDWEAARVDPGARAARHRGPADPGRARRPRPRARALIDHGVPTTYCEYPMGHSVAVESLQEAHALARRRARGREADGADARRPRPSRWCGR